MRYISANEYLAATWRLAAAIRRAGWRPDTLIALWRGGAPVGVAVHEFLAATGWKVRHMPLKCASYTGIGQASDTVEFTCGDEIFGAIGKGERVLVVDDVFDSGRTAAAVKMRLEKIGAEMRFACVYWKKAQNKTTLSPDYFVADPGDEWIVFPHEIEGLSREQIAQKDPELWEIVKSCNCEF